MKRELFTTADGSKSLHIPEWDEQYHSKHGAIAESRHVFIEMGLMPLMKGSTTREICILEIGFGTGLNAFLTYLESKERKQYILYQGVEAYPVRSEEASLLNYSELLNASQHKFAMMHSSPWEEEVAIDDHFTLKKRRQLFSNITDKNKFNLIYFDAFGARVQPELWTESIFQIMFDALKKGGVLVTYAAKGSARRAMQAVGFEVERLPGPPGKREMLRARKV